MKSKTTITVETVKQFRILHASHEMARSCPFCGAETAIGHQNGDAIACEIVESTASKDPLIAQITGSENNE